jgi:hypothetical protein
MRLIIALCFLVMPVAARARTCDMPLHTLPDAGQYREVLDTIDCLLNEIDDLKQGQAVLADEIERLKSQLAKVPGEYINLDGKVTTTGGDKIAAASFRLTSQPDGRAASLAIDHAVWEALCADGTGCTLSLFTEADGLRLSETAATAATGPCALNYTKTSGAWSVGAGCGGSAVASGTDGNAEPGGLGGGEVVMVAGEACILADADASRTVGGSEVLGSDGVHGFFLVAKPGTATDGRFRCVLTVN